MRMQGDKQTPVGVVCNTRQQFSCWQDRCTHAELQQQACAKLSVGAAHIQHVAALIVERIEVQHRPDNLQQEQVGAMRLGGQVYQSWYWPGVPCNSVTLSMKQATTQQAQGLDGGMHEYASMTAGLCACRRLHMCACMCEVVCGAYASSLASLCNSLVYMTM